MESSIEEQVCNHFSVEMEVLKLALCGVAPHDEKAISGANDRFLGRVGDEDGGEYLFEVDLVRKAHVVLLEGLVVPEETKGDEGGRDAQYFAEQFVVLLVVVLLWDVDREQLFLLDHVIQCVCCLMSGVVYCALFLEPGGGIDDEVRLFLLQSVLLLNFFFH